MAVAEDAKKNLREEVRGRETTMADEVRELFVEWGSAFLSHVRTTQHKNNDELNLTVYREPVYILMSMTDSSRRGANIQTHVRLLRVVQCALLVLCACL